MAQAVRGSRSRAKAKTGRSRSRRSAKAARKTSSWRQWLGILAFAFAASAAGVGWVMGSFEDYSLGDMLPSAPASAVADSFSFCRYDETDNCVVDGDTFRYRGMTIRIADIDTPEVFSYRCESEKALGDRATQRLHALLNDGGFALEAYSRDEDQYGRKLRIVTRNGQSLGMMLVSEGLAREWDGRRRSWC